MKVAIFGLGYVGFTAACCIAKEGHHVLGIDVSDTKVRDIIAGIPPITEPGVIELMQEALEGGRLEVSTSIDSRFDEVDLAIVCVGTPSSPDGSHNMGFVAEVSRQIASSISTAGRDAPLTVAFRSTFRPGTIVNLVAPIFESVLGQDSTNQVELVYNPEFLRESSAVEDYFHPPKIVIGTQDGRPSANMDALHQNLDAQVFNVPYAEAEFTKFVDNTWHAVKVAYANEIGRVCQKLGVSAATIHKIFVSDTKLNLSSYYTRPGGPFGGSCLPKDVRALQHISMDINANTHLVDSLLRSNEVHKNHQLDVVTSELSPGAKVLMVGLAFKADTDDLRESPSVDMARKLLQRGFNLSIYDSSLIPSKLKGQNLGYTYTNLPTIDELLIDRSVAETSDWDCVVFTNKSGTKLQLHAKHSVHTYMIP